MYNNTYIKQNLIVFQTSLDLMLLLVSRLVYTGPEFVVQLCDSLSALKCSRFLGSVLEDPETSDSVKLRCLEIVNRVLSSTDSNPTNDILCIVKDIFDLDKDENEEKLTKTFSHLLKSEDCDVVSKTLFLIGLWCRIDKKFSDLLSKSRHFKELLSSVETSQNEKLRQLVLFCKKWMKVI